jgi:tetratricopeptide (TPR) repeat protein
MSLPVLLLLAGFLQQSSAPTPPKLKKTPDAPAQPQEQNPPEEDESLAPKEYAFNPIQAAKEIRTGDFYMKKGKYKAAVARYLEATRWNTQSAEAFRKLGEAQEKQDEPELARAAYKRSLELGPDAKEAAEIRKHLQKLM